MKRKLLSILGIVVLVAGMLAIVTPVAADGPPEFPTNEMTPPGPHPIDGTYMLGEKETAARKLAAQMGTTRLATVTAAPESAAPAEIGDKITITVSDSGLNVDYDETFVVVLDGTHGIILVTEDAYESFDGTYYHFANPYGDGSDPWLRTEDLITPDQLEYMLDQFDTVIYPTDTSVFGEPLPRGDEGQKVWILIFNIRDEAYYDPEAESYVAGYFSASEDLENNKNMMHIDTYDWENRVGPDAARPYLYEGVFAHEFQHLIHFDQDPDEPSWVDEAMADLAGFLCGYGHPDSHLAYYLVYHPMVSLTFWGGGLEDYGATYLFGLYLYEKFGESFISALVQEQANGIEGVENTFRAFGLPLRFADFYDVWTIANYLDNPAACGGLCGYENLEIGGDATWGWSIEDALLYYWEIPPYEEPFEVSSDWFYGIEPQPYTAHYFRFNNDRTALLSMDGDDFSGTLPHGGDYEWYSDADAWAWRSFYQTFDIPADGATLNFWTFFDIEEDWDYGYVEVYDHDTDEWYTLDAPGTVDYVAHEQDNPNCPAGREPSDYLAAGRWHGFTGASDGWTEVSMDLGPFADHTIDLYFTTWQDGAFTLQMMWVDDISIPEIGFSDDVEAGEDGWTSTGWYVSDGMFDNGFSTTAIRVKDSNKLRGILRMFVNPNTQSGILPVRRAPAGSGYTQVAIVSNRADHILSSHYEFEAWWHTW
jgi:immune inhibitor A